MGGVHIHHPIPQTGKTMNDCSSQHIAIITVIVN